MRSISDSKKKHFSLVQKNSRCGKMSLCAYKTHTCLIHMYLKLYCF